VAATSNHGCKRFVEKTTTKELLKEDGTWTRNDAEAMESIAAFDDPNLPEIPGCRSENSAAIQLGSKLRHAVSTPLGISGTHRERSEALYLIAAHL